MFELHACQLHRLSVWDVSIKIWDSINSPENGLIWRLERNESLMPFTAPGETQCLARANFIDCTLSRANYVRTRQSHSAIGASARARARVVIGCRAGPDISKQLN